jgi:cobalt-zinc-cadmium efflux system protein
MSHDHHLNPTTAARHRGRLSAVLAITVTVLIVELVGALTSGSLTLLADAGHLAADAAGIAIALFAVWIAGRPPTILRTFGWQRAEVLAACLNAVILLVLAGFVLVEALRRLSSPPEVTGSVMLWIGSFGLLANLCSLALLRRGQAESLNVRGAFLEVLADAFGSAAVIVAALLVQLTGFRRADAIAAMIIGLLILPRTWRLFAEAVEVLLEATPKGLDLDEIRTHLLGVAGVIGVHDLHAWTITSGQPVLSAHIVATPRGCEGAGLLLDQLGDCVRRHFSIEHCTFQVEPDGHRDHETAALHR